MDFYHLKEYNSINISGKEKLIWSRYPDLLIENVRAGQSLKNDLEDVYNKTEKVIFETIDKLQSDNIIICSDHGYIRTESNYNINIQNESWKKALRELFDGARFSEKDDSNKKLAEKLLNKNMIAETDNHYLPISHFSWPISGSYSTFTHGGLSLLEVITPKIIIEK